MVNYNAFLTWFVLVGLTGMLTSYFGTKSNNHPLKEQLWKCISKDSVAGLSNGEIMEDKSSQSQQRFVLCMWLHDAHLLHHASRLKKLGLDRLEDAYWLEDQEVERVLGPDTNQWSIARHSLPQDKQGLQDLKNQLFERVLNAFPPSRWNWVNSAIVLMLGLGGAAVVLGVARRSWSRLLINQQPGQSIHWLIGTEIKRTFLQWLSGHRALASNAEVVFHWQEPCLVGNVVSFTIKFYQRSGRPYPISDGDQLRIDVKQGLHKVAVAVELGGTSSEDANQVKASFTVRKAGQYYICLHISNIPIKGSPYIKNFIPGPPDASKTLLVRPTSMAVCTTGVPHQLLLEPRDEFGNPCAWAHDASQQQKALDHFSLQSFKVGSMDSVQPLVQWLWVEIMHRLLIHVTFLEEGIYLLRVHYDDCLLNKGEFNMIALSRPEAAAIEKNLMTRTVPISYEAKLLSFNGEKYPKAKKVTCALSPKQLAVREYILGFIPRRIATFRLRPSTKFIFHGSNNQHQVTTLSVEDGAQVKVELASKDGHLMAATFTHYLLKNIGGSETFRDKQEFFYQEVRRFHQKRVHDKLQLRVERQHLLESSMKAVKNLNSGDWCRNFEVTFIGEQGLDWGGVRREWIELLCVSIFDRKQSGLFTSFSDDAQALVHPNPRIPATYKLKHYEFAGKLVGKCLYESSLGATYRQLVKARFTRSFLAQLIGLRVHYKYFEQDEPDLYLSKIKYIEDNDVSDMDLTFTEDEYDDSGQLIRTVELIPGGSRIPVTNENKIRYLDGLAQHRLVNSVKEQVEAFVRGLNELIPDNLLSIFDENELELLVCGTSEYSMLDLKAHHVAVGSSPEFTKVLSWFWTAVSNFGPEQLSRLLQFSTGSSQLPSGGLAELTPKFQITAGPTFGTLPTAHTCFNQLCLPDYDNYEQFEKALLLAINEGSEGFGLV